MKKFISFLLILCMTLSLCACGNSSAPKVPGYDLAHILELNVSSATLDGNAVEEFDYTWHCDPSVSHDEVKNAPAEYYTGTAPETDAAVYIDHELYYFPALDESAFQLINYDGEQEWAYYYYDGEHDDYIFATLPHLGNALPTQMMHSENEAAENKVLHITQPGSYVLQGEWKGQIWIDLGDKDETFDDPDAKILLIFNGVNIECSVAPGLVVYSAYECDNTWESRETYNADVDCVDAGVSIHLADGTVNTVSGTNVFRMLKPVYKDESSTTPVKTQKKLRKTDAAFYSYVSMFITGMGELTVNSGFEGLDSELHLQIAGGNITVNSQDDGINVNEDNVSVAIFSGGNVTINAAQGAEGDGVDSNGFIALRGGTLSVNGIRVPDNALDSENGIFYDGGTVIIDGEEQRYTPGSSFRETGGMGERPEFGNRGEKPGFPQMSNDFDLKEFKEKVAALEDDATMEDVLNLLGFGGMGGAMERPVGDRENMPPEFR